MVAVVGKAVCYYVNPFHFTSSSSLLWFRAYGSCAAQSWHLGRILGRIYNILDNWQVFVFLQMELYYLEWQFLPLAAYQRDMICCKIILKNNKYLSLFREKYCFSLKQHFPKSLRRKPFFKIWHSGKDFTYLQRIQSFFLKDKLNLFLISCTIWQSYWILTTAFTNIS